MSNTGVCYDDRNSDSPHLDHRKWQWNGKSSRHEAHHIRYTIRDRHGVRGNCRTHQNTGKLEHLHDHPRKDRRYGKVPV